MMSGAASKEVAEGVEGGELYAAWQRLNWQSVTGERSHVERE